MIKVSILIQKSWADILFDSNDIHETSTLFKGEKVIINISQIGSPIQPIIEFKKLSLILNYKRLCPSVCQVIS